MNELVKKKLMVGNVKINYKMNTEILNSIFTKEGRCKMLEMILNEIAETTLEYEKVEFNGMLGKVTFEVNTALNTLEAKEVDLEKELDEWMKYGPHTNYPWCTIPDAIKITAEHFFELGMQQSKNDGKNERTERL